MQNENLGNPAVVGLAGFGLTTLLLQFHNLSYIGLGPVVVMAFIFGGLAQLIAGFMEQKTGNNFGFAAFSTYGSFWIGLGLIWMFNTLGIFESSTTDVGFYLLAFTFITMIFLIASLFIHTAMFLTFASLFFGFVFLDLAHFGFPEFTTPASIILIFCALSAWYMMAAIIINQVAGKEILKTGKPLVAYKK